MLGVADSLFGIVASAATLLALMVTFRSDEKNPARVRMADNASRALASTEKNDANSTFR